MSDIMTKIAVITPFLLLTAAIQLHSQELAPRQITTLAQEQGARAISAGEAAYLVSIQRQKLDAAISIRSVNYPIDSIKRVVAQASQRWLSRLKQNSNTGIQLDPLGMISVVVGQESTAKQIIAERLSTRHLSFDDRAFTYMAAVYAFSDQHYPERLSDAEMYLKQLDAMGDKAAYWQFQARRGLVKTYYMLGAADKVSQHGMRAIQLTPILHFIDVGLMFPGMGDGGELYAATVDALAGQPGGKAKIEELNALLRQVIVPSPAVVAMDTGYVYLGGAYATALEHMIRGNAMVGTEAKAIVSNYWVNHTTSDSAVVKLNDGKVRVLEFGSYSCPPCLAGLKGMERLRDNFSGVETMFVTSTLGYWGNRLVEPDEEAGLLADAFQKKLNSTIPIAIWKTRKVANDDNGITPDGSGPNFDNYPMLSKPTIWIVDGKGMIRRVILGYDRDKEAQLAKTLGFLLNEAKQPKMDGASPKNNQ